MGGSRDARINQPANLITLCGSATDPRGCHQWAERHRTDAGRLGYLLGDVADAETVAVHTWQGWRRYLNDGTIEEAAA